MRNAFNWPAALLCIAAGAAAMNHETTAAVVFGVLAFFMVIF